MLEKVAARIARIPRVCGTIRQAPDKVPKNIGTLGPHELCSLFFDPFGELVAVQVLFHSKNSLESELATQIPTNINTNMSLNVVLNAAVHFAQINCSAKFLLPQNRHIRSSIVQNSKPTNQN